MGIKLKQDEPKNINRHNTIVISTCIDYTHDGQGVCKIDGKPIFVKGLLIGENAEIELIYNKKDYAIGKINKIFKLSKDRIQPVCKVATSCGGCCFQVLDYKKQLEYKKNKVMQCFSRIGKIDNLNINDTIGMENPYNYRNKIQLPVKFDKYKKIVTGFYKVKSHDIVPIDECAIENTKATEIIKEIKNLMRLFKVDPYNEDKREGIVRHILIRTGYYSNEIMVCFITNIDSFPGRKNFIKELTKRCPQITTIVQNINTRQTNVILGERENILYGRGYIIDELCGLKFQISAKSFYQVNPVQTEKLYNLAILYAKLNSNEVILDAYSGIGTIGLIASKYCKKVYSVEVVKEAVLDGIKNSKLNNITNVEFINKDATEYIDYLAKTNSQIDAIFIDPPRTGSTEQFLNSVISLKPKKVIYISCDPATLARDIKFLKTNYEIEIVQPVDMFPMTFHVETIVLLEAKQNKISQNVLFQTKPTEII